VNGKKEETVRRERMERGALEAGDPKP